MAGKLESKIQNKVIQWCKRRLIRVIRLVFRPGVAMGWPDTLILLKGGRPAFIEFKKPGAVPTAKQQERINWLRENGYRVGVFADEDAAQNWLDALRRADEEGCEAAEDP